jgi:hypothetical protein
LIERGGERDENTQLCQQAAWRMLEEEKTDLCS